MKSSQKVIGNFHSLVITAVVCSAIISIGATGAIAADAEAVGEGESCGGVVPILCKEGLMCMYSGGSTLGVCVRKPKNLAAEEGCRPIDFERSEVVKGPAPNTHFLIVRGTKNWVTIDIRSIPLIYVRQPEYWEIGVWGCQEGVGLPT